MKRTKKRQLSAAVTAALGASVALSLATGDAFAQAQTRERIEVTGSNIKRTDTEPPSVVQVITREQIERSGATSVAELLREIPAIAGGSAQDFGGGSGFQRGNQTASLRGLGSVATLVLLNGRRVTPAPYADPNIGQGTSFNLNTIPLSAVERIDVLKDGASAIYGSDAIAGVINIILRKDYRGAEVRLDHWQKLDQFADRNYESNSVSGSLGFGDLGKDRYNVVVAAEWYKREPVWIRDGGSGIRNAAYATLAGRNTPSSAISYPANVRRESSPGSGVFLASGALPLDPRCPPELRVTIAGTGGRQECRWNLADSLQVVSELERKGVIARGTYQISSMLSAFAELGFTRNEAVFTANPPGLDAAAPSTWFNRDGQRFSYTLILPIGHPDNPNNFRIGLRYRFADLGTTQTNVNTDSSRVVAGLNGTFGAWDWESAIVFNKTERDESSNGILYFPALQAAVNNGTYRFFGNNDPALLAALHPYFFTNGVSKLTSWDLRGSRELWQIKNGPVALATGVEIRKEEMDITSDPRTVAGDFLGVASSTVHGKRNLQALFAELSIPVFSNVETQLATRYDRYSDYGHSLTSKVGAKWLLTPELAARATWSQGFRAPSLFQISNSNVQAFNAGIVDPLRCPNPPTPAPGAEAEDCNRTISTLIQSNPNLQPEKSTAHTLGLIFSPSSSFSVSADMWYVHRRNFIDRFDSGTVIRNEFNPNFQGGIVLRNPNPLTWLPGIPNSGPILSTIRRFDNFGGTAVRGVDVDANARVPIGSLGKLNFDFSATYYANMDWQLGKGVPYISGVGNFYAFEAPRFRAAGSVVWDTGPFEALARWNYTSQWYYGDPTGGGGTANCYLLSTGATLAFLGECYVHSWETYDLGLAYKGIRNLKFGVLVRNIFNRAAPYDPNQTTLGFNPTFANPYGRYMQASLTYTFK